MISSVSRTDPSVTKPPIASCLSLRNLISPPTLSHGPTDDMTRTSLGPHFSNASYFIHIQQECLGWSTWARQLGLTWEKQNGKLTSGDSPPAGLSCAMSGRAGTKLSVTARPTHFMPLANGRAPSIWALGHPMTQRPSTKACVEREPSFFL